MKTTIALIFFVSLHTSMQAQIKPAFSSQNYVGILEGESGTALQLQTINGFRYRGWFAGAGTGIDYYYFRSVPVFLSLAKFIQNPKVPLYFTGDVGVNFPWHEGNRFWTGMRGEMSGSLYWGSGVGYRFGF